LSLSKPNELAKHLTFIFMPDGPAVEPVETKGMPGPTVTINLKKLWGQKRENNILGQRFYGFQQTD
jgi:hypothetical protein